MVGVEVGVDWEGWVDGEGWVDKEGWVDGEGWEGWVDGEGWVDWGVPVSDDDEFNISPSSDDLHSSTSDSNSEE